MCTSVNGGMLYEFKVNNCIKSNLKLSSPSPRIAATTWSAPSFNFSGHCRQVEAHLEQHLRVYVLQRGRRSRNSLTGIWCKCTCQQQCSPRCSWQPLAQLDSTVSKRVLILRTRSLIRTFLAFWVLIGSLFILQGPYFHCFGFIHAKNVNSVCMYNNELSYSVCDE